MRLERHQQVPQCPGCVLAGSVQLIGLRKSLNPPEGHLHANSSSNARHTAEVGPEGCIVYADHTDLTCSCRTSDLIGRYSTIKNAFKIATISIGYLCLVIVLKCIPRKVLGAFKMLYSGEMDVRFAASHAWHQLCRHPNTLNRHGRQVPNSPATRLSAAA